MIMTAHNTSIEQLNFKGNWRTYQQRVLDELNYHLSDKKLNVVAAPGAGKTILGIEVLTRLKSPALILVPTITIKNQWKQRIINNFLKEPPEENFISTDIENIGTITISTYQKIHTLYKTKEKREKFFNDLKAGEVKTLVLDEAHHLRTEWYLTLHHLCKELDNKNFRIVSLTGTPPYDVSPSEWHNYSTLCGPVDAEISIPELVKAGDLCPHQDLIYFSELTENEQQTIADFEERRKKFFEYINKQPDFLYMLESSPFVKDIENNIELIYQNTEFTIALVSFLLNSDSMHIAARYISEFLEIPVEKLSDFSYQKAETLLNGILGRFKQYFKNTVSVKSKLKELNLINGNKADITGRTDFKKLYARSRNKLDAILQITQFEYNNIKDNLREVVLLDFIGKGDSEGLNIISVFDKLASLKINLGILTGTLIVIPNTAKETLYQILKEKNIDAKKVITTEFNQDYLRVETYGNPDIVSVITELFSKGCMNVIIGTAALLGEGWDSPCVNTLIIASITASFMMSNQMRGRALRIDKTNSDKYSNIWHLVSICSDSDEMHDLITIDKRFQTFEGISYNNTNRIQNGLERLGLNLSDLNCEDLNKKCLSYAKKRNHLKDKWQQIFEQSQITEEKIAPLMYDIIEGSQSQTSVITCTIPKWCSFAQNLIEAGSIYNKTKRKNIFNKAILKIAFCLGWIRSDYQNIVNQNYSIYVEQTMFENFAKCLLKTLCQLLIIKTDYDELTIKAEKKAGNKFYMTLIGCTNYERNIFIKAFEEIFKIDNNYRYILKQNDKYLGVPNIIGSKQQNVKLFVKTLKDELLFFDIIFTRNPKGYKELLKANYNILETSKIKTGRIWI